MLSCQIAILSGSSKSHNLKGHDGNRVSGKVIGTTFSHRRVGLRLCDGETLVLFSTIPLTPVHFVYLTFPPADSGIFMRLKYWVVSESTNT